MSAAVCHPPSGPGADPVAVLVRRGDLVESVHRVAYAVADAGGTLLQHAGDVRRPVFPRSSVKPLQALPLRRERCGRAVRAQRARARAGLRIARRRAHAHRDRGGLAGAPRARSVRPGMRRACPLARGHRPPADRAAPAAVAAAQQLLGQACRHAHPGVASGCADRRLHRARSPGPAAHQRAAGGDVRRAAWRRRRSTAAACRRMRCRSPVWRRRWRGSPTPVPGRARPCRGLRQGPCRDGRPPAAGRRIGPRLHRDHGGGARACWSRPAPRGSTSRRCRSAGWAWRSRSRTAPAAPRRSRCSRCSRRSAPSTAARAGARRARARRCCATTPAAWSAGSSRHRAGFPSNSSAACGLRQQQA